MITSCSHVVPPARLAMSINSLCLSRGHELWTSMREHLIIPPVFVHAWLTAILILNNYWFDRIIHLIYSTTFWMLINWSCHSAGAYKSFTTFSAHLCFTNAKRNLIFVINFSSPPSDSATCWIFIVCCLLFVRFLDASFLRVSRGWRWCGRRDSIIRKPIQLSLTTSKYYFHCFKQRYRCWIVMMASPMRGSRTRIWRFV